MCVYIDIFFGFGLGCLFFFVVVVVVVWLSCFCLAIEFCSELILSIRSYDTHLDCSGSGAIPNLISNCAEWL